MSDPQKDLLVRDEVMKDLNPILDLFGGADGGVAFSRLRHSILPSLYGADDSTVAADVVVMVKQFSRLCNKVLEREI